jgi:hypothetical protein
MARGRRPKISPGDGECVRLPDGRIGRVRGRQGSLIRVRVRRRTSDTHQFVMCPAQTLESVTCPKGWMSPDGYRRYLRVTLRKMRERNRRRGASGS